MPSAMVGNSAVQSATPELGNGNHCETMKQVLAVVDKKVRNMEKKKVSVFHKKYGVSSYCLLLLKQEVRVSCSKRYDMIIPFKDVGKQR